MDSFDAVQVHVYQFVGFEKRLDFWPMQRQSFMKSGAAEVAKADVNNPTEEGYALRCDLKNPCLWTR
jgi:hypothetical protein